MEKILSKKYDNLADNFVMYTLILLLDAGTFIFFAAFTHAIVDFVSYIVYALSGAGAITFICWMIFNQKAKKLENIEKAQGIEVTENPEEAKTLQKHAENVELVYKIFVVATVVCLAVYVAFLPKIDINTLAIPTTIFVLINAVATMVAVTKVK